MPKFALSAHQNQALNHLGIDAWYLSPLSRESGDITYQTEQAEIARLVEEMRSDLQVAEMQEQPVVSPETTHRAATTEPADDGIEPSVDMTATAMPSRMTVNEPKSSISTTPQPISEKVPSLSVPRGLSIPAPIRLNPNLDLTPPDSDLIAFPSISETITAQPDAILAYLKAREKQTGQSVLTRMLEGDAVKEKQGSWLIVTPPPTTQQVDDNQLLGEREQQLLTAWLGSVGQSLDCVYTTPIIKQSVHRQMDPSQAILDDFLPVLAAEITLLKPMRIIVMGRVANHALLQTKAPLSQLMSVPYQLQRDADSPSIPLMAMPCMGYFLAMPSEKGWLWKMTKHLAAAV